MDAVDQKGIESTRSGVRGRQKNVKVPIPARTEYIQFRDSALSRANGIECSNDYKLYVHENSHRGIARRAYAGV